MASGGWDTRVPLVHGEELRDALKPHNREVQWVAYDQEGHGWARPENRIDFWTRAEKFLARNLAKDSAPQRAPAWGTGGSAASGLGRQGL